MMDKIITVSIAAYNVESYLRQTLDSFICDDDTMDAFEVIIVNDGSKDSTPVIAQEYVDRYPDTFVLIDKTNGGYGSTINASLEAARGKYYKLVDGDDWVDTEQFAELARRLSMYDADMVLTRYYCYDDTDGSMSVSEDNVDYDDTVRSIDDFSFDSYLAMHQIAFRTQLLRDIGLRITEKCFYTDLEYNLKPLPYIRTVLPMDLCVYVYRTGREGQSVQMSSWFRNIDQGITVSLNLARYYEKVKNSMDSDKIRRYIRDTVSDSTKNKYMILVSMPPELDPKEKLVEYDKQLKNSSAEIYKNTLELASERWKLIISLLRSTKFAVFVPVNRMVRKRRMR